MVAYKEGSNEFVGSFLEFSDAEVDYVNSVDQVEAARMLAEVGLNSYPDQGTRNIDQMAKAAGNSDSIRTVDGSYIEAGEYIFEGWLDGLNLARTSFTRNRLLAKYNKSEEAK